MCGWLHAAAIVGDLRRGLTVNPEISDRFGSHLYLVHVVADLPRADRGPDLPRSTHWPAGPGTNWVVLWVGLL